MNTLLRIFLLGSLLTAAASGEAAKEPTTTALFNGRDLIGWYVHLDKQGTPATQDVFTVTEGMLHAYANAPQGSSQPFGYLITHAEYSDYRLTFEYKWGTKKFAPRADADSVRDAGVCYHVRGVDEIWPASMECQIQEGDTGDAWLIHSRATSHIHPDNLNYWTLDKNSGVDVTKGDKPRGYQRFFRSYSYEQPGWNLIELIVQGDTATYLINGHVANRLTGLKTWDPATSTWVPLTKGKILLQAEGAEIYYRSVVLQPLPSS